MLRRLILLLAAALAGSSVYPAPSPAAAAGDPFFGASIPNGVAYADEAYGPVEMTRVFFPGAPGSWGTGKLADRRPVSVSFKYQPSDVLAGRHDAALRAWFAAAPTDRPTWWTYYHEPEDNFTSSTAKAAYRQAWQRIAGLADQAGNPQLQSTLALMDWTLDPRSKRNWRDWYPGAQHIDVLAWDVYGLPDSPDEPQELMAAHQQRRPSLAITRAEGKQYAIAELGYSIQGPDRPGFITDLGAWARANDVLFVAWWDQLGESGDYRLTDQPSRDAYRRVILGPAALAPAPEVPAPFPG
jgi:hypothetical protein